MAGQTAMEKPTKEMLRAGDMVLMDVLNPVLGYVPYGGEELAGMVYIAMQSAAQIGDIRPIPEP